MVVEIDSQRSIEAQKEVSKAQVIIYIENNVSYPHFSQHKSIIILSQTLNYLLAMDSSSLNDRLRFLSRKKQIINALQYMLRFKDHSVWWTDFPNTPFPDIKCHRRTRMAFHSFDKLEEHRESHHAALFYGGDDNDQDQFMNGVTEDIEEASDWQGQDGSICSHCEHFRDIWIMEEWVFGV